MLHNLMSCNRYKFEYIRVYGHCVTGCKNQLSKGTELHIDWLYLKKYKEYVTALKRNAETEWVSHYCSTIAGFAVFIWLVE